MEEAPCEGGMASNDLQLEGPEENCQKETHGEEGWMKDGWGEKGWMKKR